MKFFLGTHRPYWLWDTGFVGIPLFVSARTLRGMKAVRRAVTDWGLDSAGFTELTMSGYWTVGPDKYAAEVVDWSNRIGRLLWAAPQDWMCEEYVCASTALAEGIVKPSAAKLKRLVAAINHRRVTPAAIRAASVAACLPLPPRIWQERIAKHQRRTVANYLRLRELAPSAPFVPVLQGFAESDYVRHATDYARAGVDLTALPLVGVGSVCRRQAGAEAAGIIRAVRRMGIKPHGFGFKSQGIAIAGRDLESADSLAWSYTARLAKPLPGCSHGPRGTSPCNNCPVYARQFYHKISTQTVPPSF